MDKTYTYKTDFSLTSSVNDFAAAKEYLTDEDMAKYLRCDVADKESLYFQNTLSSLKDFAPEDIVSLKWVLTDVNCGYIELKTTRPLDDAQKQQISNWIHGQCSDGLGEGFEQQEFAESYNEQAYKSDLNDYEAECELAENEVREDCEGEGLDEDTIEMLVRDRVEQLDRPCRDDYMSTASFDWETNNYVLHDVKQREKEIER